MKTNRLNIFPLLWFGMIALIIGICIGIVTVPTQIANAKSSTTITRYVSAWTNIEPGSSIQFLHGLEGLPLELDVWISLAFKTTGERTVAVPYQEFNGLVKITSVTISGITIQNNTTNNVWIRVVASP